MLGWNKPFRLEDVRYPVLGSAKLDGVRCLGGKGPLLSRTLKPIPNKSLQWFWFWYGEQWFDGELISGDPTHPEVYRKTVSAVMTEDIPAPEVRWYVFDHFFEPNLPFTERYNKLQNLGKGVILVPQTPLHDPGDVETFYNSLIGSGYEGICLRNPAGIYKYGRSTFREQYLLKLKEWLDDEGVVTGFEERMHNANLPTFDERGYTKRSSHQENKIPTGTLGSLVVNWRGRDLRIGTGFSDLEREQIWRRQDLFLRKIAKFKYTPVGMKDLPRQPKFVGWRDKEDM
jgi:DNA ligase-1